MWSKYKAFNPTYESEEFDPEKCTLDDPKKYYRNIHKSLDKSSSDFVLIKKKEANSEFRIKSRLLHPDLFPNEISDEDKKKKL